MQTSTHDEQTHMTFELASKKKSLEICHELAITEINEYTYFSLVQKFARSTKARDVAKQRGGDSPPRPCAAKGSSRYTTSQQQPVTSASPTSSSAPSTINIMPPNYCTFGRKPAPSARIYLSSACSLLLAFGCNIAVRDTRSQWPVGTRPEKEGRNKRSPARMQTSCPEESKTQACRETVFEHVLLARSNGAEDAARRAAL